MSLKDLREKLQIRPASLLGCQRRNNLIGDSATQDYRFLRGNALLELAGRRVPIETPVGTFDAFINFGWRQAGEAIVLAYRGGRWKPWWDEDLKLLTALVRVYRYPVVAIVVLHELDNELNEVYIEAPSETAEALVQQALARWDAADRIAKNSDRGKAFCPYCPVKARCDVLDLEEGRTGDWPKDYRQG